MTPCARAMLTVFSLLYEHISFARVRDHSPSFTRSTLLKYKIGLKAYCRPTGVEGLPNVNHRWWKFEACIVVKQPSTQ